MSQRSDRAVSAAHIDLARRAVALIRDHGAAVCLDSYYPGDFSPSDGGAVCVTFDGDVGTLHYTADGYDAEYSSSVSFDARCLWSAAALKRANRALAAKREAEAKREKAARYAAERARYEALRRKFEPTGSLRGDILKAMAIETQIAEDEEASALR